MTGTAVVIDDELACGTWSAESAGESDDRINLIVDWFERNWNVSFVKALDIPDRSRWESLLKNVSFVLLDWNLWRSGAESARRTKINEIVKFLQKAQTKLVPVFIFTNESPDDVTGELPSDLYRNSDDEPSFIFVQQKILLWSEGSVNVETMETWIRKNASVYALKTWDWAANQAKSELFHAMCSRSMDWPRVFWKTYKEDGVTPSSSLTNLINQSLMGRMSGSEFSDEYFEGSIENVSSDELRRLIGETSFLSKQKLSKQEIRCGDLFKYSGKKYWLNIRPDCDCIPRENEDVGDVEVYCIRGKRLGPTAENNAFDHNTGSFRERIYQCIVFAIEDGTSVEFNFKHLKVMKFSDVRSKRVGRLLHPHLTRVQQRYALYTQRQALPRVPSEAIPRPKP